MKEITLTPPFIPLIIMGLIAVSHAQVSTNSPGYEAPGGALSVADHANDLRPE